MNIIKTAGLLLLLSISITTIHAQKKDREAAILFGLSQPLVLGGFNFEANYFTKKLSFDYSHGISLNYTGDLIKGAVKQQHLVAHLPYSVGVGIGYRFTSWLNLRLEPKWHRFEIFYEGENQTLANRVTAYNTFTLGLGLYGKWHPFKNQNNFLKGIMVAPSVRWWPNVSSSLSNDSYTYSNKITGQSETHKAMSVGANNTPWLVNVSVGYRFVW
jgi:hypothetical protein